LETAQVLLAFSTNASVNRSPIMLEKMPAILLSLPQSMEKVGFDSFRIIFYLDWLVERHNHPNLPVFAF
jgi:methylaspartate ammonia-lyase